MITIQCQGVSTRRHRNGVFLRRWDVFSDEDFARRLTNLYRDGDLVINCRTCAKTGRGKLRELVEQKLSTVVPSSHLRVEHPAN
jgi:hypothetical protein